MTPTVRPNCEGWRWKVWLCW